MPEYLAPGVYVEEVSFRAKSIEGVPTSTTGMAGMARFGPVQYAEFDGPSTCKPRLITSYTEFERVYGGLAPMQLSDGSERVAYLAHAARAFFNNGGRRLYVSRVYQAPAGMTTFNACGQLTAVTDAGNATWRARWPGEDGNVLVETRVTRSRNLGFNWPADPNDVLNKAAWGIQVRTARAGAVVEVLPAGPLADNAPLTNTLYVIEVDNNGRQTFIDSSGNPAVVADGTPLALVELRVIVRGPGGRIDSYEQLGAHSAQSRHIGKVLERDDPEDENAMVWLDLSVLDTAHRHHPAALMKGLQAAAKRLAGGVDGAVPAPDALRGNEADVDHAERRATGLEALGELEDIAIVAMPDSGVSGLPADPLFSQLCVDHLVAHAEKYRYRIAVADARPSMSITDIREFRGRFDSKYAALYHPWIEVLDPMFPAVPGVPPRKLLLPPSGFVCGIYARSDIERGVHKAPANEVVRGLTQFEININKARQDVLNPEGVNCLRFFEGRGSRVWGARTMSSDPEWKYVNVRRLFIYVEHSIEKATQWAVFEPNQERLWANIRRMVEDFLLVLWRDGALVGAKPEEAYFVRCDRSTMTQNDLDNGRMICQVGIAPSRPAEFVIFRVGQWTADAQG
ncbi:phage tail sheath family protein [Ideonella sp. 4Y11]|uniref:Phage tail sheath family protein n=1 Tax=Ideonella aquatica TaxID=2824119 RepID=A0A940YDY9_9BURK|nr:phage tail sheath subtilisin-like domain-containing protein [Ideonella aquatica]MBQ0957504.1 phage tail sheath family protein [Ideonella aquatica]